MGFIPKYTLEEYSSNIHLKCESYPQIRLKRSFKTHLAMSRVYWQQIDIIVDMELSKNIQEDIAVWTVFTRKDCCKAVDRVIQAEKPHKGI